MNILSACIHVMDLFSTGFLDPASSLALTDVIELSTGICENSQCPEAATKALTVLKSFNSTFTVKNKLKHYA